MDIRRERRNPGAQNPMQASRQRKRFPRQQFRFHPAQRPGQLKTVEQIPARSLEQPAGGEPGKPVTSRCPDRRLVVGWRQRTDRQVSDMPCRQARSSQRHRLSARPNPDRRQQPDRLLPQTPEGVAERHRARPIKPLKVINGDDHRALSGQAAHYGQTFAAITYLEKATTDFGGIALRYGGFYGAANDALIEPVRKRQFPVVGGGGGIFSWLHLDDGAAATVAALERSGPAIYNIVDDEPAPVRDWLPVLANALGAKPPRHVPAWMGRLFAGQAAVVMGTQARGASNAKAKRELGWTPRYPSWRLGFPMTYPAVAVADGHAPDRGTGATRARD